MHHGPPRRPLTFADWLHLPHGEGGLHEILGGEPVVAASFTLYHQTVARRLQFQLYERIELRGRGQVFDAPAAVRLSDVDVVEPDLWVVLREHEHRLCTTHCDGPPDLIVEVLSPDSLRKDRVVKAALYERCGVPEYWIVDPDRHAVDQLVLAGDRLRDFARSSSVLRLHVLGDVAVDLARVW